MAIDKGELRQVSVRATAISVALFGLGVEVAIAQVPEPPPAAPNDAQSPPSAIEPGPPPGIPWLRLQPNTPTEREAILKRRAVATGAAVPTEVRPLPAQTIIPRASQQR
jgi:hypothetical protein